MAKGNKIEVHGMHLEPIAGGDGGVTSTTMMRSKRGGTGGGPEYDHTEEKAHHSTLASLHKHIAKHMGPAFGEQEHDAEEPES